MSSTDGSERPTEKQLYEGDKEVTHICMRIDALEVMCVVEERRSGVTFGAVIRYLNEKLRNYLRQENQDEGIILIGSIVPPQDFLAALEATERITIAELFVDKEVMGTDYLGFLEIDASTREEVVMTVKSKPKQSIAKRAAREAYFGLATEGTRVRRIRLRGRDYNNMSVIIDSLNAKKKDEVFVELMPNGIVNTASIFQKMEEALQDLKRTSYVAVPWISVSQIRSIAIALLFESLCRRLCVSSSERYAINPTKRSLSKNSLSPCANSRLQ